MNRIEAIKHLRQAEKQGMTLEGYCESIVGLGRAQTSMVNAIKRIVASNPPTAAEWEKS